MSYEMIALIMFASMMLMMMTGQRIFAAIGFIAVAAALPLWGDGGFNIAFSAGMKLMKWYPLLTLPLFIYMGYMFCREPRIAEDLYQMFHVWMGPVKGGLAIGTIGLMVIISAMNGLSVAGMAIGATIALPELLKPRHYDKVMVTGVIQAGSHRWAFWCRRAVVLVLYGMIARQPVGQLWLAGVIPRPDDGRRCSFIYIVVRCRFQPELGPVLPEGGPSGIRGAIEDPGSSARSETDCCCRRALCVLYRVYRWRRYVLLLRLSDRHRRPASEDAGFVHPVQVVREVPVALCRRAARTDFLRHDGSLHQWSDEPR